VPALSASGAAGRPRSGPAAGSFAPSAFPGLEDGNGTGAGAGSDQASARAGDRWQPPPPALRSLPARAVDLTAEQRDALGNWLKQGWPGAARAAYQRLAERVSFVSLHRWQQAMDERGGHGEAMLWRLLRMGSAPYFVLGSSATRSLRLRIATPWDWREHFVLGGVDMTTQQGGQPRVGWHAAVRDRSTSEVVELNGHIEVRWSHGRFGGPPEAKGYLDTPHHLVPGYFALR
jgi:hypothetical protein